MLLLSIQHVHDWSYLTEGNAHLILNYTGNDAHLKGHVLRLSKNHNEVSLDFHTDFGQHVITPLLGSGYAESMTYTEVTLDFIQAVGEKIHNDRPAHRRQDPLHPSSHGFLTKNWTLLYAPQDTWTFEIKPKWGFLPNSPYINEAHQALKKSMCRFCMHQRLRQQSTLASSSAHYCPLDLYSGDPQRIRKALTASLTCPHNYLKLFCNGQLLPPAQWSSRLPSLFGFEEGSWVDKVADLLTQILLDDPILQILKRLQRSLDEYDVEGIYPLYEKHGHQPTHDIEHWKRIVQRYLNRQSSDSADVMDEQEERQRLYEYVLSMTLKDCSVMVCLTRDYGSGDTATRTIRTGHTSSSLGHCFQYQIKVVDVDMKKWTKIPFWYDLDRRIIQHNLEQHGWICLD